MKSSELISLVIMEFITSVLETASATIVRIEVNVAFYQFPRCEIKVLLGDIFPEKITRTGSFK
jgi:hypothetical protein